MPSTRAALLGATLLAGLAAAGVAAAQTPTPANAAPTSPADAKLPPPPSEGAPAPGGAGTVNAPNTPSAENALSEVVVTGSRIRRPNVEANTPVAVLGQRDIEISGFTDVGDLLQKQPQVGVGVNPSNTTNVIRNAGLTTISLRDLGTSRTLTLVDGRRQVGGGVGSTAVDINSISKQTLDRIDIVTGGSSATYGADAVAGVVNFITRQNIEGAEIQTQFGGASDGGYDTRFIAATVGHNFLNDRANITLTYADNYEGGIFRYQRDYALSYLANVVNPARTAATATSTYAYIPLAGVTSNVYNGGNEPLVVTNLGAKGSYYYTFDATGNLTTFNRGTVLLNGAGQQTTSSINCSQCFRSVTDALRDPLDHQGAEIQGHYDFLHDYGIFKDVNFFLHGKYYQTESLNQSNTGTFAGTSTGFQAANVGAQGGLPAAGAAYPIAIDNAYLNAAAKAVLSTSTGLLTYAPIAGAANQVFPTGTKYFNVSRIDNDLPLRVNTSRYDMGQLWTGFNGNFVNDWHFEVFASYGETDSKFVNVDRNEVKFFQQIDAVTNPANGQIVCRSTLTNPGNGCVPLNIVGSGQASAAAVAYSYLKTTEYDTLTQTDAQANIDGKLFTLKSPFSGADLPVRFAAGFEFRRETSLAIPDILAQQGVVFGNRNPISRGHYSTREEYAEVNIPVLRDLPFVQNFEVDAQARHSDFNTTGGNWSYSANGNWQINPDIKFRGGYARAVRAPNIGELFASGTTSYAAITDPCDVNNVNLGPNPANRIANCRQLLGALAGAPYSFTQSPATKATQAPGNPNLQPETADTYTGGVVFTPRFVRGLTLTIDYYSIQIAGAIAAPYSANAIAANCVDTSSIANAFCAAIQRGSDGNISNLLIQSQNVASLVTEGWDLQSTYVFDVARLHLPDWGRITLNLTANYVPSLLFKSIPTDNTTRDQEAGEITQPKFRASGRVTWDYGPFTLSYSPQYYGRVKDSNEFGPLDYQANIISEFWQHDIRAEYRLYNNKVGMFIGVNNLTNNAPPYNPFVFTGAGSGASLYGPIGRYVYGGVNARF